MKGLSNWRFAKRNTSLLLYGSRHADEHKLFFFYQWHANTFSSKSWISDLYRNNDEKRKFEELEDREKSKRRVGIL